MRAVPKISKPKSSRNAGSRLTNSASNSSATPARARSSSRKTPSRGGVVWGVVLGAMTLVGGLMFASGGFEQMRSGPAVGVAKINDAPTAPWSSIVIHSSGTPAGSLQSLERAAQAEGFDSSPFHFVIGNGLDATDGAVMHTPRWSQQRAGVRTADRPAGSSPDAEWFNQHAISICLVGSGDRRAFTQPQLDGLLNAVNELQRLYNIPDAAVFLHSDLSPISDPGAQFPREQFFSALSR